MNNFEKTFIHGTNYKINRGPGWFKIVHKSTGANVAVINGTKKLSVGFGQTPKNSRGQGIGTHLRRLVTLYAKMVNKPITHQGMFVNVTAKGLPSTTRIVRGLGWRPHGPAWTHESIFDPKRNSLKE
jgi:hypothetical protein